MLNIEGEIEDNRNMYFAIGYMSVRFQDLEESLCLLIMNLGCFEDLNVGRIFVANHSFSSLVSMAWTLLEQSSEDQDKTEIKRLFSEVKDCAEKRNSYIHSRWADYNHQSGSVRRIKVSRKEPRLRFISENVEPDEVNKLAGRMNRLASKILTYLDDNFLTKLVTDQQATEDG